MDIKFPYDIRPDAETRRLYDLAARIGARGKEGRWWSFSSVLLAFLHGEDPGSHWFTGYVRGAHVRIDELMRDKFSPATIAAAIADSEPFGGAQVWTQSAREVFLGSVLLAERVVDDDTVRPRHVMGAYCAFHFPNHENQLRRCGFRPEDWFPALVAHLDHLGLPDREAARWRALQSDLATFGRDEAVQSRKLDVEVRRALSSLYSTVKDAQIFVSDVGLVVGSIDLSGSAENVWFSIVEQARKEDKLPALIDHALERYGGHRVLLRLKDSLRP